MHPCGGTHPRGVVLLHPPTSASGVGKGVHSTGGTNALDVSALLQQLLAEGRWKVAVEGTP